MTDSARLPGSHYWPGLPTPFWQWFRQVDAAIGTATTATVDLSALTARVAELESDVAAIDTTPPVYTGFGAVRVNGQSIRLLNDVSEPGATKYYGTDDDENHGWYTHAVSTLADVDLTGLADGNLLRWIEADETWQPITLTDFAATLLDDADAATARATLGITDSSAVPTLIAAGDTYTVAANTQVLWADDIDIEGTLDVSGSFIEVN